MQQIPLTQGRFALVDDEDYPKLIKYKWQYHCGYAKRGINTIRLHREILNCPKDMEVDHINGNKLDCRKSNLRLCRRLDNVRNVGVRKDNRNGYKGVHFHKSRGTWMARIQVNGKRKTLGYFHNIEDAAKAYDAAATRYFGEYAYLNFPT